MSSNLAALVAATNDAALNTCPNGLSTLNSILSKIRMLLVVSDGNNVNNVFVNPVNHFIGEWLWQSGFSEIIKNDGKLGRGLEDFLKGSDKSPVELLA